MKILTYNVRSWYRDLDRTKPTFWRDRARAIRSIIAEADPDVLLLQECLYPMTARVVPDNYVKASGCSISHHVFIRKGYAEVEAHGFGLHHARARLRLHNASRWEVLSIHSTWKEGAAQSLADYLVGLPLRGGLLIAGGDWNEEPEKVRQRVFPYAVKATGEDTFENWDIHNRAELDYFVTTLATSAPYDPQIINVDFGHSDHLPVVLELP